MRKLQSLKNAFKNQQKIDQSSKENENSSIYHVTPQSSNEDEHGSDSSSVNTKDKLSSSVRSLSKSLKDFITQIDCSGNDPFSVRVPSPKLRDEDFHWNSQSSQSFEKKPPSPDYLDHTIYPHENRQSPSCKSHLCISD